MPKMIFGKREDLAGKQFGALQVIGLDHLERLPRSSKSGAHGYWVCKCECGRKTISRDTRLKSGATVSCGCYRADSEVRRKARLKVPRKERKRIASIGAAVRWENSNRISARVPDSGGSSEIRRSRHFSYPRPKG